MNTPRRTLRAALAATLAATLTASPPAPANNGVHVIGDSISALPGTWPELLANAEWRVFNQSMSTRMAVQYEPPRDLLPWDAKRAVLFLGTNDGLMGQPLTWFGVKYSEHASTFLQRGFGLVMVAPPTLDIPTGRTVEQNAYAMDLCQAYRWFTTKVRCLNPDDLGYAAHTTDGVHPDSYMSQRLADAIGAALSELREED